MGYCEIDRIFNRELKDLEERLNTGDISPDEFQELVAELEKGAREAEEEEIDRQRWGL